MRQKRTEIARRRAQVADWYCEGKTVYAIAELAGVHHATITRDLQAIRQEWREQAAERIGEAVAAELAKIDKLEREYWEAWRRSCKDTVTVTDETNPDGSKHREQRTGQAGNPAFLAGVQWCVGKRLDLLGAMPAKRTEITGLPGGPITVVSAHQLDDDQLAAIAGIPDDPIAAALAAGSGVAPAGQTPGEVGAAGLYPADEAGLSRQLAPPAAGGTP